MKRLITYYLLISCTTFIFSQTTIAVLEFDTEGVDNISSSALASIVRREVLKSSDYRLIDRNAMNEILIEQGLSQSGCVSSECAIEVGKLLGVQQMVSGSLSALGSLFLLDINIIDVSTGEIIKTESVEHIGKIEELISPLRTTVKSMLGGSILNAGEALIYIESIPSGAMVYMDGKFVGSSPLKHTIDTKSYNITLKAKGYTDWFQEIKGKTGETVLVKAELLESRETLEGGLASNEIGKWEVLGISREDYIDFLRFDIDERDWIENLQPLEITVGDLRDYYNYKIPRNWWIRIKNGKVSIHDLKIFINMNINEKYWVTMIEEDISIELANRMIFKNYPTSLWAKFKKFTDSYPDVSIDQIENYFFVLNQMGVFIDYGIMSNYSYKQLEDEFGPHVFYLSSINNTYNISESLSNKIYLVLKDQIINPYNFNKIVMEWKQQIFNGIIDNHPLISKKEYKILMSSISKISIWEWFVVSYFNISINEYIEHWNQI